MISVKKSLQPDPLEIAEAFTCMTGTDALARTDPMMTACKEESQYAFNGMQLKEHMKLFASSRNVQLSAAMGNKIPCELLSVNNESRETQAHSKKPGAERLVSE